MTLTTGLIKFHTTFCYYILPRNQTDHQTHERDKHYAENEADIETPSPDEITQAEMIHRVIIKIGPVFPHHDINHDANINEEKQSYYQDSLFFLGK